MAGDDQIPLELDVPTQPLGAAADARPRMSEPLPVRLVAVEDVKLPTPPDIDDRLDAFYVALLEFERVSGELTYRSDNFLLRFDPREKPVEHDSMRPLGVDVMSLAETEKKLLEAELEYTRIRGV